MVFARLLIKAEDYGVHAFLVNLRDPKSGETLKGISISDMGFKPCINGNDKCVDDAREHFPHYLVSVAF